MNKMFLGIFVFALTGLPWVSANEVDRPEQDKRVCIQLPCPDDCGLEALTEQKPEVVCVPLVVKTD